MPGNKATEAMEDEVIKEVATLANEAMEALT